MAARRSCDGGEDAEVHQGCRDPLHLDALRAAPGGVGIAGGAGARLQPPEPGRPQVRAPLPRPRRGVP